LQQSTASANGLCPFLISRINHATQPPAASELKEHSSPRYDNIHQRRSVGASRFIYISGSLCKHRLGIVLVFDVAHAGFFFIGLSSAVITLQLQIISTDHLQMTFHQLNLRSMGYPTSRQFIPDIRPSNNFNEGSSVFFKSAMFPASSFWSGHTAQAVFNARSRASTLVGLSARRSNL